MGTAARLEPVCDATGRFAAHPDAARSALSRFLRNDSGATAIEYALIAVFLSVLILVGVTSIGTTLTAFFQSLSAWV
jgi:pilus assembly protein Flp/PilA